MAEQHPNEPYILKAGDRARDFSLANTDGRLVSLTAVLEKGPAVVIFYRGDW